MLQESKKPLRITAFVLNAVIFLVYAFIFAFLIYGSNHPDVLRNSETGEATVIPLDTLTETAIQVAVYLFLLIAAISRDKKFITLTLIFALASSVAFSFMGDFSEALGLVDTFKTSLLGGFYLLLVLIGDVLMSVGTIFYCISTLEENGTKNCRIALFLFLSSTPFYLISTVLIAFALDHSNVASLILNLFLYSVKILIPLSFAFNIDGYTYPRKLFTHEK
jgi:hypothetical protein